MPTDRQLIDAILRHQMYLEQLTRHKTVNFTKSIAEIAREVRKVLNSIEKNTMRELTFREINLTVRKIVDASVKVYDAHLTEFNEFIDEFTEEESEFFAALFGTDKVKNELLDSAIKSVPMAATGLLLQPFLQELKNNTSNVLSRTIRAGYGSNLSLRDLLNSIVGTKSNNYRDGILNRVFRWQKTTLDTAIQHTSSTANYETAKRTNERYRWISILDSVTCDICADRNDTVYYYGDGPVPPEHPNCRCDIIPIVEDENIDKDLVKTFNSWMRAQDADFRMEVSDDTLELTFDEFKKKLRQLLTRYGD